ncbi:hypothetical protein Emed_006874 [Eimeria media]
MERCRKACGGHGYMLASGVSLHFVNFVPQATYEVRAATTAAATIAATIQATEAATVEATAATTIAASAAATAAAAIAATDAATAAATPHKRQCCHCRCSRRSSNR